MPTFHVTDPSGKTYEVSAPEGATQADAVARVQSMIGAQPAAPQKGFGEQLSDSIRDIPRQVGLTARYGLEGVGDALEFVSAPIRGALNTVLPKKQTLTGVITGAPTQDAIQPGIGGMIADSIGLPKPENGTERVVGDVARTMATGGGFMGGANRLAQVASGPITRATLNTLASNAGTQTASNAAAGGAGGYVRETGGDPLAQGVAAVAAGVVTPFAMNKLAQVGSAAQRAVTPAPAPAAQNAQIDIRIERALQGNGLTLADIPDGVRNSIRSDVAAAMRTDGQLSPDAIRRLADYRLTGATPTQATLTLDPAQVTQQKNLAKLGINSKDAAAQQLGRVENANNQTLISNLNELGANTPQTQYDAGGRILQALDNTDQAARGAISEAYGRARDSAGRSANLDPSAFTQRAGDLLNQANAESFLPAGIRDTMNRIAQGQVPLNVEIAEQLKTNIGRIQRSSQDGNTRYALGLVRQALDEAPLVNQRAPAAAANPAAGNGLMTRAPGELNAPQQPAQNLGQEAIDAFNQARGLNRNYMRQVEGTPALQAVRDGVQPDKFVQTYIVGNGGRANVADLQALRAAVEQDPAALSAVRNQIAAHLKNSALNGAADEVGNVSQSAYNKALRQIGDEKLSMFFNPEEVNQLRAVGRVASYEQFQPKGSAVNNSNTAGAGLAAILDRIANSTLLSKVPFGKVLAEPAMNISIGMQAKNALNPANGLVNRLAPAREPNRLLLSPAALLGVGATEDERRNSLAPGR